MKNVAVKYCSEDDYHCIEIEKQALEVLLKYKQDTAPKLEAGGQIFAKYNEDATVISYVTEPSNKDKRKRMLFLPDIFNWRRNTKELYKQGLHYIGDWHTHPERNPRPSAEDIRSIHSRFNESKHELTRMVMIIVGKESDLYIGLSDGECIIELKPVQI